MFGSQFLFPVDVAFVWLPSSWRPFLFANFECLHWSVSLKRFIFGVEAYGCLYYVFMTYRDTYMHRFNQHLVGDYSWWFSSPRISVKKRKTHTNLFLRSILYHMKIAWVCRKTDMQESCSFEHVDINSILGSNKSEASTIQLESWNAGKTAQTPETFKGHKTAKILVSSLANVMSWKISNCVHAVFYKNYGFSVAFWDYWRVGMKFISRSLPVPKGGIETAYMRDSQTGYELLIDAGHAEWCFSSRNIQCNLHVEGRIAFLSLRHPQTTARSWFELLHPWWLGRWKLTPFVQLKGSCKVMQTKNWGTLMFLDNLCFHHLSTGGRFFVLWNFGAGRWSTAHLLFILHGFALLFSPRWRPRGCKIRMHTFVECYRHVSTCIYWIWICWYVFFFFVLLFP